MAVKVNWSGAAIGAILGLLLSRHPAGIVLGGLVGGLLTRNPFAWESRQVARARLLEPWFMLGGALARANGRVSDAEVKAAEHWMRRLALDDKARNAAIDSFNAGKADGFVWQIAAEELAAHCVTRLDLKLMVLDSLHEIGSADGSLSDPKLFDQIRESLAVPAELWHKVLSGFDRQTPNRPKLAEAYRTLAVDPKAIDDDVRKAYRRAISKYHPDKIAGLESNPERVREFEQKARDLNIAYDVIRDARGMS
ncbi:MAG: DnaJ domain-containing protein [Ahniella sp.]|nr:DnaJ domain-containing protein [Ahniella sp.]